MKIEYNQVVWDCISGSVSEATGVTHHPGRLYLPATTDEFPSNRFERPGRTDFPGSIPPLSETAEPALIYTLLTELSSKFKRELGSEPNLSRKLTLSPNLPKAAGDTPALFIGGSNADRLAKAAANVGIVPDTVTEGGWVLNTTSVSTVLPPATSKSRNSLRRPLRAAARGSAPKPTPPLAADAILENRADTLAATGCRFSLAAVAAAVAGAEFLATSVIAAAAPPATSATTASASTMTAPPPGGSFGGRSGSGSGSGGSKSRY